MPSIWHASRLAEITHFQVARVYAAYGGVYILVAVIWLWLVDGIKPTSWDIVGALVACCGMAIIMFAPRNG